MRVARSSEVGTLFAIATRCLLLGLAFALTTAACGSARPADPPYVPPDVAAVAPPAPRPPTPASSATSPWTPSSAIATNAATPAPSVDTRPLFDVTPPPATTATPGQAGSVAAIMTRLHPGFSKCYRDALADQPGLVGDMQVDVEVETDGSAGNVKVLSAKGIPVSLSTCITLLISAQRYDAVASPHGVIHLVVPVHFAEPQHFSAPE